MALAPSLRAIGPLSDPLVTGASVPPCRPALIVGAGNAVLKLGGITPRSAVVGVTFTLAVPIPTAAV